MVRRDRQYVFVLTVLCKYSVNMEKVHSDLQMALDQMLKVLKNLKSSDDTHTHPLSLSLSLSLNFPLTVSEDSKSSDDEFGFLHEEDDGLEATASVDHYESLVSLTLPIPHTLPLTYPSYYDHYFSPHTHPFTIPPPHMHILTCTPTHTYTHVLTHSHAGSWHSSLLHSHLGLQSWRLGRQWHQSLRRPGGRGDWDQPVRMVVGSSD